MTQAENYIAIIDETLRMTTILRVILLKKSLQFFRAPIRK